MPSSSSSQPATTTIPTSGSDPPHRRRAVFLRIQRRLVEKGHDLPHVRAEIRRVSAECSHALVRCFLAAPAGDRLRARAVAGRLSADYVTWCVEMLVWAAVFAEEGDGPVEHRLRKLGFRAEFPPPDPDLAPWDARFAKDLTNYSSLGREE